MNPTPSKHVIAFFSVSGSTAKVAAWIEQYLTQAGQQATLRDLTFGEKSAGEEDASPGQTDCLWVLSPVYSQHPAPAVSEYLGRLPQAEGCLAVPVVTYGVVCSGTALYEMGHTLQAKGYHLAGGAKVVAEHSIMWPYDSPLGQGRPNEDDQRLIQGLAQQVIGHLEALDKFSPLALEALNYQPEEVRQIAAGRSVHMLKNELPPMQIDAERCDQCGLCAEGCCQGNIVLDPLPVFGDDCIYCLNCLRICPQAAIDNPMLAGMEKALRQRAASFGEATETVVF